MKYTICRAFITDVEYDKTPISTPYAENKILIYTKEAFIYQRSKSREHSIVGYAMKEIWSKMNDQKEKYSITQILKFANFKTVLKYNKIYTVSLRGE